MKAMIVSIGDELVLGQVVDTNAAWLSERLGDLGVAVVEHVTVGDDFERLAILLKRSGKGVDVVMVTGGLGPTEDDLTRQVVAVVVDRPLVLDKPSLEHIREMFQHRGKEMPERNVIQAMIPQGCEVIANPTGTAAGLQAKIGQAVGFFLPGVPSEMEVMYNESVEPVVGAIVKEKGGANRVMVSRRLHVLGMSESKLAETLGDLMTRGRNPVVNSTVAKGIITLRINVYAQDAHNAKQMIEPVEAELREKLGTSIYGSDGQSLGDVVVKLLSDRGQCLSVAESCTGGWLAKTITDTPGASEVFDRGWVTYSNQAKQRELEVPRELLEQYGAVSCEVCKAMAQNSRRLSKSDYSLAITGIAGPGGSSETKPVGRVFIGLSDAHSTEVKRFIFHGSRDRVRRWAVNCALDRLRYRLL